jgi:hypothetical protein
MGEAAEIEQISRDTLPLLEEVCDHVTDQQRVNHAIAKIDALRSRIDKLGPCYQLVTQLTQRTELARFKADRAIAAARVDGIERQRRQVQRDIDNVRSVLEAAQEFQNLMTNAIENVQHFARHLSQEAA